MYFLYNIIYSYIIINPSFAFSPEVGFYFPTLHFISGQDSHVVTSQQVL